MSASKDLGRRLLSPALLWLMGAHFLQGVGWASMLLLPLYVEYLGGSRATIGWVMGLAAVSGLLMRPIIGLALDRWGRRKTVATATITLTLGMLMIGLVTELGPLLYVSRLVVGVGVAALFTGYFTFASDLVTPERRTEGLAIFGVSGLAPLLVNPISELVGVDAPGLRWFYPLISVLVALSLIPLFQVPETIHALAKEGDAPTSARNWRALLVPELWPVWLVTIIFGGLVVLFLSFATVAARSAGLEQPTSLWFTYAGGAVVVRLVGAKLPDVIGTHNMVVPALAAYIGAALLLADASSSNIVLLGGLFAGLAHGYAFPVVTSQVITRVPADMRGVGMSVFTGLWDVSRLLLAPALGAVADATDDSTMFACGAVGACILLSVWVIAEHVVGRDDRKIIRAAI